MGAAGQERGELRRARVARGERRVAHPLVAARREAGPRGPRPSTAEQTYPLVVDGALTLASGTKLRSGELLAPTLAGWQRYLELAPASGSSSASCARRVAWWDRKFPLGRASSRELLARRSRARPRAGARGEAHARKARKAEESAPRRTRCSQFGDKEPPPDAESSLQPLIRMLERQGFGAFGMDPVHARTPQPDPLRDARRGPARPVRRPSRLARRRSSDLARRPGAVLRGGRAARRDRDRLRVRAGDPRSRLDRRR
jgi:hypothetical protein